LTYIVGTYIIKVIEYLKRKSKSLINDRECMVGENAY